MINSNNQPSLKYSLIIPAWNGIKYLPACVDSIVSQGYADYELIISDDHSTDGSKEYLATLAPNTNVRVIEPPEPMSMTEHWEWAVSHARGRWLMFVGQDDGVQPYFFQLADKLTAIAEKRSLRTIMSKRAFFFWEGCDAMYGDTAVNYHAIDKIKIKNSKYEALKALLGIQAYFELPQMYTTSLFERSILEEARTRQGGRFLTCHPQDANLAAIACSLDNHYLKSFIPLGWVGTSPKSAGMAISISNKFSSVPDEINELAQAYKRKVEQSKLSYDAVTGGSFAFGDTAVYFWQAILKTPSLRSSALNDFLVSKVFKTIFLGALKFRLGRKKQMSQKRSEFQRIVAANHCSGMWISFWAAMAAFISVALIAPNFAMRVIRKVRRHLFGNDIVVREAWGSRVPPSMSAASSVIASEISQRKFI